MKKTKYLGIITLLILSFTVALSACSQSSGNASVSTHLTHSQLVAKAKKEGKVVSVGMPDSWANWVETWKDIKGKYGINHSDTDMTSAEEVAKFKSDGKNGTADIGDVGVSFGPVAAQKNLLLPYKTQYWNKIPAWAKDKDGKWVGEYYGTISFLTDKKNVKNPPKSWADLLKGNYKVDIFDPTQAAESQFGILAASLANGGSVSNITPGLNLFKKLAQEGRLSTNKIDISALEKGEVDVAILWDFNSLGYRDQVSKSRFDVTIPKEASVSSCYVSVINKNALHPYAGMLARDYILSDKGQINLAKGYARPIRSDVKLPASVQQKLLPASEYKSTVHLTNYKQWDKTAVALPQKWQQGVMAHEK
ncbi:MAG: ABC transporter substrate-binding protein [Sporolactobacillus sp.]